MMGFQTPIKATMNLGGQISRPPMPTHTTKVGGLAGYVVKENTHCPTSHGHYKGHKFPLLHQRMTQFCNLCKVFVMHRPVKC